jgi:hypothetical protein
VFRSADTWAQPIQKKPNNHAGEIGTAFNQVILMRNILSKLSLVLAAVACALVSTSTTHAGEITGFSWHSGVASLASTSISPLVAPNNDDAVGASPNTVFVTQKDYVGIGPVDIVFNVSNSGGVSEYLITEGVYNGTGLNWAAYHIELGFGFDAGFVGSGSGDGLDFDSPSFNSPFNFNPGGSFFPTLTVVEDDIYASGGVMPNMAFAGYFRFTVDVPDGITSFTVRQSPIPVGVPEPGSLSLSVCGIAGVTLWRRRRN